MFPTNLSNLSGRDLIILVVLTIWSLSWKGLALWKASKKNHKIAFIIILILNTVGIVEIIYLAYLYIKDRKQTAVGTPAVDTTVTK